MKKVVIFIQDEKPDCAVIEAKLKDYLNSLSKEELKKAQISLHMPECNLLHFVHQEKEFTKNLLHQKLLVKFNHRLLDNDKTHKKVIVEKSDRAGNKDQITIEYDELIVIDTTPR
jgi:hypothetical protein